MHSTSPRAIAPATLTLLAATAVTVGCRSSAPVERVSAPVASLADELPVVLEHVSLALSIDPVERLVEGRADLTLRADQPRISVLPLQLERLAVQRVRDAAGGELAFSQTGGEVAVMLAAPLLEGETVELSVDYAGHPERGLTFVEEPSLGELVVHTDGRPGTSVWWFPSLVREGQNVTSDLTLDLPAAWIAAGSGRRERTEAEGRASVRFVAEGAHPLDALGFVAGGLLRRTASEAGSEISVLGSPARPEQLDRALDQVVQLSRFAGDLLGPAAELRSLAVVHLPSAERPGAGALGLAFAEDLQSDSLAREVFDRVAAGALRPAEWSDTWMPGAVGRYLAALYAEGAGGREALAASMEAAAVAAVDGRPRGGSGSLASSDFVDPSDLVDGGWRNAVGAQVLHLVRGAVGDEAFLVGLRDLFEAAGGVADGSADGASEARANGAAVTDEDLFAAIGSAAEIDLEVLRAQWVDAPGAPRFEVSWEYDAAAREVAVRVRQRQSGDDGTPRVFEVPVEIEIVAGAQTDVHRATLTERSETLRFDTSERPRWIRFDRGDWLPGVIDERKSADEWMALTTARDDVSGRMAAVAALAREALEARRTEQTMFLTQLGGRLERDASPRVRRAAATALGQVGGKAARLWLEDAADADGDARVRAAALEALVAFTPSAELAALAVERLDRDPEVAAAALALRAAAEPASAGAFLRARWTAAADPRVRSAVVEALAEAEGSQSEPWLLAAATDEQLDVSVRRAALAALADRGVVANETAAGIAELLGADQPGVRQGAVEALVSWPNAPARRALQDHYPLSVEPTERRAIEAALRLGR